MEPWLYAKRWVVDIADIHDLEIIGIEPPDNLSYSRSMGGYGIVVKMEVNGKHVSSLFQLESQPTHADFIRS